jgi:peptidyl-dipeptidase Dcp
MGWCLLFWKIETKIIQLWWWDFKTLFQVRKCFEWTFTIAENYSELLSKKFWYWQISTKMFKLWSFGFRRTMVLFFSMLIFSQEKEKRNGLDDINRKPWKMESMKDHMFLSFVISHLKELNLLLTFNEVTTLFHEFGHALHGMLANTTYQVCLELQFIGILWIAKPSNGKLVLRTGSIGIVCKTLWNGWLSLKNT